MPPNGCNGPDPKNHEGEGKSLARVYERAGFRANGRVRETEGDVIASTSRNQPHRSDNPLASRSGGGPFEVESTGVPGRPTTQTAGGGSSALRTQGI